MSGTGGGAPTIRLANHHDDEAFADFMNAIRSERLPGLYLRAEEFSVETVSRIIDERTGSPKSILLLAEHSGELVGILDTEQHRLPAQAHSARCNILVARTHRGRGVGAALLADLILRIEEARQIRRLEAEVLASNVVSLRLCARFGFVEEGRKRDAVLIGGAYVDNILLGRLWPDVA